jgi:hypothetical protein
MLLQIAAVSTAPLARVLHATPMGPSEWLPVLVAGAVPAVLGQLYKLRWKR